MAQKNTIICIGRQFGSGGRDIGRLLAEKLNIQCYDKELLAEALKNSILPQDILEQNDGLLPEYHFFSMYNQELDIGFYETNSNDIMFSVQKKYILEKSKEGPCVFVGRCADAILEKVEDLNVISVFVAAAMEDRICRVMEREKVKEKEAASMIRKIDKQRKNFYSYHTEKDWGKPSDYDIIVNSSRCSEEEIVDLLTGLYNKKAR